jgi:hypothetical protein
MVEGWVNWAPWACSTGVGICRVAGGKGQRRRKIAGILLGGKARHGISLPSKLLG